MNNRQLFLQHIAQTSASPLALEMVKARGINLWDAAGKKYIDLIAGFCVANIGHSHPHVVAAVQKQVAEYMHLIVYGEFIEAPQVEYARLLTAHLPPSLNCVYFTNSGAEATEGAMKLAKRVTGRTEILAFNNAYHGSTQGALSLIGSEYWRNAYRPLLPGIYHLTYGSEEAINRINEKTACVIVETVQAESGVHRPPEGWLQALRHQCSKVGALLVLDEIQAGFGRTGTLWAFEQYGVVPDILLLGKALGGGMPLGAFIAHQTLMNTLTYNPVLGHITTFGGHPVSCTAGLAGLQALLEEDLIPLVKEKERLFLQLLQHPNIKRVRSAGLWLAIEFSSFETAKTVMYRCIDRGLITDWFLFAPQCLRIAPPLIITKAEIEAVCSTILSCIDPIN